VVLGNTSGRPGTETSIPVLGLVVTALPKTIPEHNSNFIFPPSKSLKPPPQTPDKNPTWLYAQAVCWHGARLFYTAWASSYRYVALLSTVMALLNG
jgi:hypothetical protein